MCSALFFYDISCMSFSQSHLTSLFDVVQNIGAISTKITSSMDFQFQFLPKTRKLHIIDRLIKVTEMCYVKVDFFVFM